VDKGLQKNKRGFSTVVPHNGTTRSTSCVLQKKERENLFGGEKHEKKAPARQTDKGRIV
jgi:hypothetical protein